MISSEYFQIKEFTTTLSGRTISYFSKPRALLNEFGDHWGQEFGHRIGRHDLYLDILPPGYVLKTWHDDQGELQREVEYDDTDFFLAFSLATLPGV